MDDLWQNHTPNHPQQRQKTPNGALYFETTVDEAPSEERIPVLHTVNESGYQLVPATYRASSKKVTASAKNVTLVSFGWFNPQEFTKTVDSYAQTIIDSSAKKPQCVKDTDKKSEGKSKLLWLCSLQEGESAGLNVFSRALVPVSVEVDKDATITEGPDSEAADVAEVLMAAWVKKSNDNKGTVLPPRGSLKSEWPNGQKPGNNLKAEVVATWLLTSALLKSLLAAGPVEKDSKTVAQLQKIDMAACLAKQAKSLYSNGITTVDKDQEKKKTILDAVVFCFKPVAAAVGKSNPAAGSVWSAVAGNPNVLRNAMSAAWSTAAGNSSAQFKASVVQEAGAARDKKYAAGAKRLRLQMGGRIVDTANGSTMPENGTKAVAWLTKILGKPSASKGSCPSGGARYYAWNNFRITVLTKDIEYEPEPFRAGTVGGWQVSLKPQQGQKTHGFRVVGENNKASKYITTGSTMVDALNLYPGATLETRGKKLTIDYFAGDITNISINGQSGKTAPTAPVETMAAGVGATCGADSNHKGW